MLTHQQQVLRLLIENRTSLFAFVLAVMRDLEAAEEVFQEVSLAVCENYDSFQIGTSFLAWSREVARRRIAAHYRMHKREREALSLAEAKAIEAGFAAVEANSSVHQRTSALHECLKGLSPFVRRLFDLRYAARLRMQQIAAQVGRRPESVRKAIYRSRIVLRQCIEARLESEDA